MSVIRVCRYDTYYNSYVLKMAAISFFVRPPCNTSRLFHTPSVMPSTPSH